MPNKAVDLAITLVAATERQLLPGNPARIYALIVNDGAEAVYLGMSAPAVQNRGIRLNQNGGSYEINAVNPWHGEIRAISAGTPAVLIVEW
ncbi:unnamed protein product [marine sediment metagenome]|uniref:Uncharacterized protein n=1 Tax=marine sediment metagenome TaxID=412755 RepID=X1JLQ7_9ZZZZ